jgi:hypothetical protein
LLALAELNGRRGVVSGPPQLIKVARSSDRRVFGLVSGRAKMAMSAGECRENAEKCEHMARSLSASNAPLRETMLEVAAQWRAACRGRRTGRGCGIG